MNKKTKIPPTIISIGGLSGAGKSTLARHLVARLDNTILLENDSVRREILGYDDKEVLPQEAYKPYVTRLVNTEVERRTTDAVKQGISVIITATHMDTLCRQRREAQAKHFNVPFKGIWMDTSLNTLFERVCNREKGNSDAGTHVVARQAERKLGPVSWYTLNGDQSLRSNIAKAMNFIAAPDTHTRKYRHAP
ncbi:MAG: AAA family ATPase [Alphaproteobacteria bacterium]|nr:AAA family ATPase [Alphaproteobacteria bacterium]